MLSSAHNKWGRSIRFMVETRAHGCTLLAVQYACSGMFLCQPLHQINFCSDAPAALPAGAFFDFFDDITGRTGIIGQILLHHMNSGWTITLFSGSASNPLNLFRSELLMHGTISFPQDHAHAIKGSLHILKLPSARIPNHHFLQEECPY